MTNDRPVIVPTTAEVEKFVPDYATPLRLGLASRLDVPISRRFAVVLFGIATWPFIWTVTQPGMLWKRPVLHTTLGAATVGIAMICFFIRCGFVRPGHDASLEQRRFVHRRAHLTLLAALGFIALHATALPLRIVFVLHYPLFDAARRDAAAMLPAWNEKPHQWIGLFPIHSVRTGPTGEIAFGVDGGGAIYFDPTPAQLIPMYYAPSNGGHLIGCWYWEATD